MAPATETSELATDWSRVWLGVGRECPQQLLVRGELTWQLDDGSRAAMLVDHPDTKYCGDELAHCLTTEEPEEYVFELHAALYAAGLASAWAEDHELSALPHAGSYFTGSQQLVTPWVQCFQVIDSMSWDERRMRKWLSVHKVGVLEVKTRNVPLDANQLQKQFSKSDGQPMTCLLYRVGKSIRAVFRVADLTENE